MKKHDVMYIHFTTALFKVVKAHRPRDPSPDGQTSGRENQRWSGNPPQKSTMMIYDMVMTNSLPWYRWPIEIDGLPIKNILKIVIFHGYVK
jgi:hypothetical protein